MTRERETCRNISVIFCAERNIESYGNHVDMNCVRDEVIVHCSYGCNVVTYNGNVVKELRCVV